MHVDRAVEGFELLALDHVHQLLARQRASGILGERDQQVELIAGHRAVAPVDPDGARARIDLQPAEPQDALGRRHAAAAPPQDGLQPGEQLARIERLRQIVVGAELEADDAVGLLALGGQHQHRHVGRRADAPAGLEAVEVGKHDVEDDRVRRAPLQLGKAGIGGRRGADRKAVALEIVREHGGQARIVVDDQDLFRHAPVMLSSVRIANSE